MPSTESVKQERMHIRLDAQTKNTLERAASHAHKSVSDFVISNALISAEKILREHESLSLSANDWNTFMDALDNPLPENDFLRESMALHKKHVSR